MPNLPQISKTSFDIQALSWPAPKSYMQPGEFEVLVGLVRSTDARVVIEFGVNEGSTAKALIREVKTIERYIGVDVDYGYEPGLKVQSGEVPKEPGKLVLDDPIFHLITRPRGTLDLGEDDLPMCDVVFIDGDHSRMVVMHDTRLAQRIVVRGGLIVWHDYYIDTDVRLLEVNDVLEELHHSGEMIQHVEGTWLAFQRVA